jgi:hypothetical protein
MPETRIAVFRAAERLGVAASSLLERHARAYTPRSELAGRGRLSGRPLWSTTERAKRSFATCTSILEAPAYEGHASKADGYHRPRRYFWNRRGPDGSRIRNSRYIPVGRTAEVACA